MSRTKVDLKEVEKTLTIERAEERARDLHQGQYRKAEQQVPYIVHPIGVAEIVSGYTEDEDVIAAALLHDTVEDCDYTFSEMQDEFNNKIVEIVKDVSEDKSLKEQQGGEQSWQRRKEKYLRHLGNKARTESLLVAAGDKIHNIESMVREYDRMGKKLWDNLNSSPKQNLWYYGEMIDILEDNFNKGFIERLKQDYKQLQQKIKK
ncbi:MAG: HD domain-containing protein [Candidatus Paceibacteria bacterium]